MSRFIKHVSKRSDDPSQAEVRRAKEFWADCFVDSILAQIDESSAGRGKVHAQDMVRFGAEVADKALEEMEQRWPKI